MMQILSGEVPEDEWLNVDTFDKFISFYDTPIDEATDSCCLPILLRSKPRRSAWRFRCSCRRREGASQEMTDIVIGKIPITMEHGYHQGHVKHLIEYAEDEYGVTVNVIDGEFSSDKAFSAVETFIAQGVDGIMLHSTDEEVIDQMVAEAHRAGIPISTFYIPTASDRCPICKLTRPRPLSRWAPPRRRNGSNGILIFRSRSASSTSHHSHRPRTPHRPLYRGCAVRCPRCRGCE